MESIKQTDLTPITYNGEKYNPEWAGELDKQLKLNQGDEVLYNNGLLEDEWVKAKIEIYHCGGKGVVLLEGRQKDKFWYLFPDRMLVVL